MTEETWCRLLDCERQVPLASLGVTWLKITSKLVRWGEDAYAKLDLWPDMDVDPHASVFIWAISESWARSVAEWRTPSELIGNSPKKPPDALLLKKGVIDFEEIYTMAVNGRFGKCRLGKMFAPEAGPAARRIDVGKLSYVFEAHSDKSPGAVFIDLRNVRWAVGI